MLRDLLTQKVKSPWFLIFDTPEHVDSENWKLAKIDRFSNFFRVFSRFSGRGTHPNSDILRTNTVKNETFSKKLKNSILGYFLPIWATFYE
jgi:hypothetical protein